MLKAKYILVVLLLATLAALFAVPDSLSQQWKDKTLGMVSPLLKSIAWLRTQFEGVTYDLKTIDQMRVELVRLQAENGRLTVENETFRNLEKENQELKRALKFAQSTTFRLLVARVIAREPSSWWRYITIDRGSEDGITIDHAVVSTGGLVGKIASVTPGTAKVVLLGDENCRVSATLEGTNEQGIVVGEVTELGGVQCRMTFISKTAAIEIGQRVYTSGLGGVFPQGILIGEVIDMVASQKTSGFGLYQEVIIDPSAELSNIHEVFVVVGSKK